MKRAIIVGAGIGGLALGIRLQSAGIETVIVEARDKPGGHAYFWERDGFTFDAGPTAIIDPSALDELWGLTGGSIADDVDLMPVMPFYRLNWRDGISFDYSNDEAQLRAEIARLDTGDVDGYRRFLEYSAGAFHDAYEKLGATSFLDFRQAVAATPTAIRHQAWRSVHSIVSGFVKNDKLRQALSFPALLAGGNPFTASALYALVHTLEREGGIWWARGGTNRLIAGMVALFERLGGTIRLGDPVTRIETLGDLVTGVTTKSGWSGQADAVATNADAVHSYRDLLADSRSAKRAVPGLQRKRWSPSYFAVHFGIKGTWPGIPHHMVLFGARYRELMRDIFDHGVLPEDMSIYLHHPTVTDPSVAPDGHSTFYALVPVPHLGKFPVDWDEIGPILEKRVLDEIGRRLIPDIHDRIITKFSYAPNDVARDLNAHLGSGFSLEPTLAQSGYFRVHHRDAHIPNLYFVGAGTHPGAGIPGVVASAKAAAHLILELQ